MTKQKPNTNQIIAISISITLLIILTLSIIAYYKTTAPAQINMPDGSQQAKRVLLTAPIN